MKMKAEEALEVTHPRDLLASDNKYIIGIDEVGTGAWAGPIVISAVVILKEWKDSRVKDSKKYKTYEQRYAALEIVSTNAVFSTSLVLSASDIDHTGMGSAWRSGVCRLLSDVRSTYPFVPAIIDGAYVPNGLPGIIAVPKADITVPAVSAASIVAKVNRDTIMRILDVRYPGYGFERNVGYGVKEHRAGILKLGLCPQHRRSYRPVRELEAEWESLQKQKEMPG